MSFISKQKTPDAIELGEYLINSEDFKHQKLILIDPIGFPVHLVNPTSSKKEIQYPSTQGFGLNQHKHQLN